MTEKEIIRALRLCSCETSTRNCLTCPLSGNDDCVTDALREAADIIERQTAENVVLPDGQASAIESLRKEIEWKDMVIALAQRKQAEAEADRDAAIADLKISSGCASCKYHCSDPIFCRDCNKKQNCKCMSCSLGLTNWKWHGLPEAPEGGMMKGASNFDKLCHQVFDGKNDGTNYLAWETDICCGRCGHKLHVYYCEERLYLIECAVCGTKALTKAGNVVFAAYKTLAHTPKIEEDEK